MTFDGYRYIKDWKWFFLFPSVVITKDEKYLCCKNLTISAHWLGWHFKWFWKESEEEE